MQRIYTNTATNTATITATNDINVSDNSSQATVKHNFLQPPILLNPSDGTSSTTYSVWPAANFGQINPFITLADGAFSFFTAPGTYRLDVSRSGYQPYRSPDLQVINMPVNHDVPLTPATLTITIDANGTTPAVATVTPGAVIAFVNVDVDDHHVMSRPLGNVVMGVQSAAQTGKFDSGVLGPNQSYKVKLSVAGTVAYVDGANAELGGVIQVKAAEAGVRYRVLMPLIQRWCMS